MIKSKKKSKNHSKKNSKKNKQMREKKFKYKPDFYIKPPIFIKL